MNELATVVIEPPRKRTERRGKKMYEVEEPAYVKFSTEFKAELADLDVYALKVFLYIGLSINFETETAYPGVRKIAADTGMNKDTVGKAIEELEEKGFLQVWRRDGASNIYKPSLYFAIGETVPHGRTLPELSDETPELSDAARKLSDENAQLSDASRVKDAQQEELDLKQKELEIKSSLSQKEKIMKILHACSWSVFKDPREWEPVKRRLEQPDIVMTGENLRDVTDPANPMLITISGLSRLWKRGPFNEATAYESMYYKSFANIGLELVFQE